MTATALRGHLLAVIDTVSNHLPARDRCTLQIEHAGEFLSLDWATDPLGQALVAELDEDDDEPYDTVVDLAISKSAPDNVLSIYETATFGLYLSSDPIQDVLAALAMRFKSTLSFECQADGIEGGARSLRFAPKGAVPLIDPLDPGERTQMLALFRESAHTDLKFGSLVPDDLAMHGSTGVAAIDAFLARLAVLISTSYLANHSWIEGRQLHYRLIGYKVVEGSEDLAALAPAQETLLKVARWCYASGGQSDKIGLARNVISVYLTRMSELEHRSDVWSALRSNYQIYLKQNVESYLALKGRLSDMLMDAAARTQALAATVLDTLRNGIFVLLTFVLTVVVVNAVKDTSVEAVFSVPYLLIAGITCIVLSIWVGTAALNAVREYDAGAESLHSVVSESFGSMLAPDEITTAITPGSKRNRIYLVKHAWQHVMTWFTVAGVLMLLLIVGHAWTEANRPTMVGVATSTGAAKAQAVSAPLGHTAPQTSPGEAGSSVAAGTVPRKAPPTRPNADARSESATKDAAASAQGLHTIGPGSGARRGIPAPKNQSDTPPPER